ncbi:MAG: O-antigen ligase family protein [Bryobacterales bacterium]|nr:O-antigen ligase family protein [Bryobacterales bacterium]
MAAAYQRHFTQSLNPALQLGFWLLMAYLFLAVSRTPEFLAPRMRLPLIFACAGLVMAIAGGGLFRLAGSTMGRLFAAFTIWLGLSIPLSVWKGGSFQVYTEEWLRSVLVFVMLAALIRNSKHALTAMWVVAWGSLVLVVFAYVYGRLGPEGRLILPIGQYSNPNDLASGLLMTIFFWWFIVASPGRSVIVRALGVMVLALSLLALVKTGSRGAMIVVLVATPILLYERSFAGLLRLAGLGVLLAVVALALVPRELRERYLTFFSAPDPEEERLVRSAREQAIYESAIGSSESRMQLLRDSLRFTLKNPILGVGIGMFAVAESEDAAERGRRGMWRGTHNTYTQYSSEAGIPALILFLAILFTAFRLLRRVQAEAPKSRHPFRHQSAAAAKMLRAFLLATSAGLLFMHVGYNPLLPTFMGIVFGLSVSFLEEIRAVERTAPATAPPPARPPWAPPGVPKRRPA